MALSVILSFYLAQNSFGTANGLTYLTYIFNFGFFITTFTASHTFYTSIVEDKEIDDYFQKLKIDTFKNKIPNYKNQKIRIRFPTGLPIVAKDKYLAPFKPLFNMTPILGILLFISAVVWPLLFIFLLWVCIGPFYLTIKRVVDVFSLELEDNTFSSLMTLPMTSEELLEEKMKSACPYASVFVAYTIVALIIFIIIISTESISLSFSLLFLPALYFQMIYSTLFIVLKSREMTRITAFIISLFLIILYFSIPFISILFLPAFRYTKKMCLKEMIRIGETGD